MAALCKEKAATSLESCSDGSVPMWPQPSHQPSAHPAPPLRVTKPSTEKGRATVKSPIWTCTTQIPTKRSSPSLPHIKHMLPESPSSVGAAVRTVRTGTGGRGTELPLCSRALPDTLTPPVHPRARCAPAAVAPHSPRGQGAWPRAGPWRG